MKHADHRVRGREDNVTRGQGWQARFKRRAKMRFSLNIVAVSVAGFRAHGLRGLLQDAEHAERFVTVGQRLTAGGDAGHEMAELLAQRLALHDRRHDPLRLCYRRLRRGELDTMIVYS